MLQKIPLKDPRLAAALMAIGVPSSGFKVEPLHHTGTGERATSWFLETDRARDILQDLDQAHPDHAHALWKTEPNSPLLVALAAIHNRQKIAAWKSGRIPPPVLHAEPGESLIFRLTNKPRGRKTHTPEIGTRNDNLAAVLATLGFRPCPDITTEGAVGFSKESITFQDLTPEMVMGAINQMGDQRNVALIDLPGYPPGQHPLCYAFAAVNNLRLLKPVEDKAWETPTHFFKGARTAFANDAALRNNAFHHELKKHLAGT